MSDEGLRQAHSIWRAMQTAERRRDRMARVSDVYGGQYLKAAMIGEDTYRMEIQHVDEELIGEEQERKLVVYFGGTDKGLVLNVTNANTIVEAYGDDTDEWTGKVCKVFTEWTEYGGKRMKGIRVSCEPAAHDPPLARSGPVETNPVQGTPPWERKDDLPEPEPEPEYVDEQDLPF